jgi:hypothetical protein
MMTPCPQSRRFLSRTAYASDQQGSCEWGPSTTPGYQYSAKSFDFSMAISNELNNKTQYLGVVDNYAIGKSLEKEKHFFLFFFVSLSIFVVIIFHYGIYLLNKNKNL